MTTADDDDGPALPLAGVKVLDLSTHACGPFATATMASLGATVLKVERPPHGDPERRTELPMFTACNGGKFSIAADLKTASSEVVDRLVAGCDVLVEGFRPGVAERLGLGFARARELQPKIVYVSLPGFGSGGPYADRRGFDVEYRALAGDIFLNRDDEGVPRYAEASPVFDFATALYAVIGVLSSLLDPDREAVRLEIPILAAGLAWSFARLIDPTRRGQESRAALSPVYRASDGRYLTITAPTDADFVTMCGVVGRPDLAAREDLATFAGRRAHVGEVQGALADALAIRPRHEWLELLEQAEVASAPVLSPEEVFADPQVRFLDVVGDQPTAWSRVPIDGLGTRRIASPPRVDDQGDAIRARGWTAIVDVPTPPEWAGR